MKFPYGNFKGFFLPNSIWLKIGDVIIGFGGQVVSSIDQLHKILGEESIGREDELLVLRNRRKERVKVTPAELK